jgi:cyanate permease
MRRTISATLFALLAAQAAPALAQEQSWETQFLLIANPCLVSEAPNKLALCQQANTDLLNKAASYTGPQPAHENNVYRAMRALLAIHIASEMGKADGVRSQRSCVAIEQGWSDASVIDTQYSPQRAADMQSIRSDMLRAVRVCRQEFGKMPAWAPDLPAN